MPPKLEKLYCRNSIHCSRSEEKTQEQFKNANSLHRHEHYYCEFNKDGSRKMTEPKGRGRPSLAETQPQKVMKTVSENDLKRERYEENVKSTISFLSKRKEDGKLPENIQEFLKTQSSFYLEDFELDRLDVANKEVKLKDVELKKYEDLKKKMPGLLPSMDEGLKRKYEDLKMAVEGNSISEEDVHRVLTETKKEYDDEVSRHEGELANFKVRKDEEIETIKREMNERISALKEEKSVKEQEFKQFQNEQNDKLIPFQDCMSLMKLEVSNVPFRKKLYHEFDTFIGNARS